MIHQDVDLYAGLFDRDERGTFDVAPGRYAWIHVAKGSVQVNGEVLRAGDAAAIDRAGKVEIVGQDTGEVLVFDLA